MSEVILKAHNGNRSKNLESIADNITDILDGIPTPGNNGGFVALSLKEAHQIKGYMEQLRIIADEIGAKK
jgi:hypothetical protein